MKEREEGEGRKFKGIQLSVSLEEQSDTLLCTKPFAPFCLKTLFYWSLSLCLMESAKLMIVMYSMMYRESVLPQRDKGNRCLSLCKNSSRNYITRSKGMKEGERKAILPEAKIQSVIFMRWSPRDYVHCWNRRGKHSAIRNGFSKYDFQVDKSRCIFSTFS